MTKTALIVVDVQKIYHEFPLLKPSVDLSLFTITPALQLFRETSNPVFFVQHADNSFVTEGSPGFKLSDAILRRESEDLIVKRYPNSFYKTTLGEKLKKAQVGLVVICGLAASKCVTATIQGALENDFSAAILQWGIADIKDSLIQHTYDTCPVVSLAVLKYFLSL